MPLAAVLQRASDNVDVFQRTFSTVVLVERHVQLIRPWSGDRPMPLRDPELAWREGPGPPRSQAAIRRRQLLSDLLLVQPTGHCCIEPESGRVWRATVRCRQPLANVDSAFEVTFRATGESDVLAPESAWEWSLSNQASVSPLVAEGLAIYSNVRRFSVTTQEQFK